MASQKEGIQSYMGLEPVFGGGFYDATPMRQCYVLFNLEKEHEVHD